MRKFIRRLVCAAARLGVEERAASAVEFALILPAFVALLFAAFQVAVFLFAQQVLQNAANEAGRLFMTGQGQSDTQAAFKTQICNNYLPSILFNCNSLVVVAQTYTSFAAASTSMPALYNNGQPVTNWAYTPGTPGQIMVVQLIYPWSVVTGPLGFSLASAGMPKNTSEMMGVTAFRIEPY
jgi:Flp pilus assembly protein TadG